MDEKKNTAAVAMGKLRQEKLNHLTKEQKSAYFSLIRLGKKQEAKRLLKGG